MDNCRCNECKYMKMNTLEKVRDCMKNLAPRAWNCRRKFWRRARLPMERDAGNFGSIVGKCRLISCADTKEK